MPEVKVTDRLMAAVSDCHVGDRNPGIGLVLLWGGPNILADMTDNVRSVFLSDLGIPLPQGVPSGVYVWEGCYAENAAGQRVPADGQWRELTDEERAALHTGELRGALWYDVHPFAEAGQSYETGIFDQLSANGRRGRDHADAQSGDFSC